MDAGRQQLPQPCHALALPCHHWGTPDSALHLAQRPQLCSIPWEGRLLASNTASWLHISTLQPQEAPGWERDPLCPLHTSQGMPAFPSGSAHMEEDSVTDRFKPVSKRLAVPLWAVYFQDLSTFIQPAFHCFAFGFLQLQALSAPPCKSLLAHPSAQ